MDAPNVTSDEGGSDNDWGPWKESGYDVDLVPEESRLSHIPSAPSSAFSSAPSSTDHWFEGERFST